MAITVVNGLTDEQLADYELRAEAAMLLALQTVADQMADQIAQIRVAAAGPASVLADVREVWAGCPHGFHPAHTGPCPSPAGAVAVLVAADPPPVPDIPGPPGQPYVSPDDLAQMTRLWDEQARQQLMPVVAEVYHTSAGTVHAQMVDASGVLRLPAVSSLAAEQYLAQAANTFDQVGDALWTNARNSLLDGFKAGDSIPELAARVRGSAQMTAPTATLVARTQVLDASNSGSISTARASGLRLRKGWFSTPDLRTRPSHMTAGHTYGTEAGFIPLEEPFYVGGQACDRPHDPVLSPAERYSCRCTVGYAVSSAAPLQRAQRPQPPLPAQSPGPVIPPLGPPAPVLPPAQIPGSQAVAELRAVQRARIEELAAAQQAELAALVADQHAAVDAVLAQQRARFAAQTAEHRARVARFEEAAAKRHIRVDEIAEEHRANMAAVTQQARERAAALDELSVQQSIAIDDILMAQQTAIRQILLDEETRVRRISADISAALRRKGVRPVPGGPPRVPPVGPAPLQRALPEVELSLPGTSPAGAPLGQGQPVRAILTDARTTEDVSGVLSAELERITGRKVPVDFRGSVDTAREHAEGILLAIERNPEIRVTGIRTDVLPGDAYAKADGRELLFSEEWSSVAKRREYLSALEQDELSHWHPPDVRGPQGVAVHEMGHILDPHVKAVDDEIMAFIDSAATKLKVRRDRVVSDGVSDYATSNLKELVAEAYSDVVINGADASGISRGIIAIVERAPNRGQGGVFIATPKLSAPRTAAQLRAAAKSFDVVIPPRLPLPALRQLVGDLESGMPAAQALERAATAVPARAVNRADLQRIMHRIADEGVPGTQFVERFAAELAAVPDATLARIRRALRLPNDPASDDFPLSRNIDAVLALRRSATPAKAAKAAAKKAPAKKAPAPKPPKPLPAPERMTGPALRKELESAGVELPAKVGKPDLQRWVTAARGPDRDAALAQIRREVAKASGRPSSVAPSLLDVVDLPDRAAVQDAIAAAVEGTYGRYRVVVLRDSVGYRPGREVHFAGYIEDAQGRTVGKFNRSIERDRDTGQWIAVHVQLELDRRVQGSGLAEAFNANLIDWYRRSGLTEIRLSANIDVGGYAWAARGFDFARPEAARRFLEDAGDKIAQALVKFERTGRLPKGISEEDLRALGAYVDDMQRGRRTASAPEIAGFGRRPGQTGKSAVWPGKWLMLGSSWRGHLLL